ncbi:MAG: metal ABC transporter ATP-binding protein [Oscillospiraceae bacterium]
MPLVKCSNLTLAYENNIVLTDVNFTIEKGDYICVVGENGSGKSTLLKSILNLKKPVSGTVEFSEGLKADEIGYLPQQSGAQADFPASVREIVLSGCLNKCGYRPFYTRDEKQTAEKNMRLLGIEEIQNTCIGELSGGQQQRVLLARALCSAHRLLLLDEPVSGLDPIVSGELYSIVKRLNEEEQIAVLMISHDIQSALANANKILHLKHSQLFFGDVVQYRKSNLCRSFSLGECNE